MIVDGILLVLQGVLSILLAPLEVINIGIDFVSSIPVVSSFLQIVTYILPWSNILPILLIIISIFAFRILISLIKTIWSLLPLV